MSQPLKQLIDLKRKQFDGLFDNIALIDFTHEEDGFANNAFGEHVLKQTYSRHATRRLPSNVGAAMAPRVEEKSELSRSVHWQIMASSTLAATASAPYRSHGSTCLSSWLFKLEWQQRLHQFMNNNDQ